MADKWRLVGEDTFSDEYYPVKDGFDSEQEALEAAQSLLKELESSQPTEESGGQSGYGIQDHIYIIRPDGSRYRFPANELSLQEIKDLID